MLWWDKTDRFPVYVPPGKSYQETVGTLDLDEMDIVAGDLPTGAKETLVEQRKLAGQCTRCGQLLPMTIHGLGDCKGCFK